MTYQIERGLYAVAESVKQYADATRQQASAKVFADTYCVAMAKTGAHELSCELAAKAVAMWKKQQV